MCVTAVFSVEAVSADRRAKAKSAADGQEIYSSMCASCHGLDGRGGERAPDIAQSGAVQSLSDEKLRRVVEQGVPGTGMPPFHSLRRSEVGAVISYLRVLQGKGPTTALPGDAARGRTLFFGASGCASCHMVAGQGGFIAADLSAYAGSHNAAEIKNALTHAGPDFESSMKHVAVTTRSGDKFDGLIRNEDNFSLQLQAIDGTFHFFLKSDVASVAPLPSIMPTKDVGAMPSDDSNDLVKFLVSAGRTDSTAVRSEDRD